MGKSKPRGMRCLRHAVCQVPRNANFGLPLSSPSLSLLSPSLPPPSGWHLTPTLSTLQPHSAHTQERWELSVTDHLSICLSTIHPSEEMQVPDRKTHKGKNVCETTDCVLWVKKEVSVYNGSDACCIPSRSPCFRFLRSAVSYCFTRKCSDTFWQGAYI